MLKKPSFDPSTCELKPFNHQIDGIEKLLENPSFFLADEMGCGKSFQVIQAAKCLFDAGMIDTCVVIAPASVRCVWIDSSIGELFKYAKKESSVYEFHKKFKKIWGEGPLHWLIGNYEFLRSENHLVDLCTKLVDRKVLLILDESSYIKNRTAAQTKAVAKLRKHCSRYVALNGTPITNSPLDLFSQMNILSPSILNNENFYVFRSKYCTMQTKYMGAKHFQQVTGYKDLDKLAQRLAPYVLRRLKADCLDLPEKLYTTREVVLTVESWKRYKELKKDAVMSLGNGDKRLEPNAAVRLMRLAQLTSGILGGDFILHEDEPFYGGDQEDVSDYEAKEVAKFLGPKLSINVPKPIVKDLSSEKLNWCVQYLTEECTAKAVIVWCRWRRERERLVQAIRKIKTHDFIVSELYGGQNKTERSDAVNAFSVIDPDTQWRRILVAQQHAGSHGLNLIAASEAIYLSNDFSLGIRLQSEDRCHRMNTRHAVTYIDVCAVGPAGQPTIDRIIVNALRAKKDVADFTCSYWRSELEKE